MDPLSHHFLLSNMAQMELLSIYRGDLNNCSNFARFSSIVVSQTQLRVHKELALNTSSFKSHLCLFTYTSVLSQNHLSEEASFKSHLRLTLASNLSINFARFRNVVSQTQLRVHKERALNNSSFKSHLCLLDTPQICLGTTLVDLKNRPHLNLI